MSEEKPGLFGEEERLLKCAMELCELEENAHSELGREYKELATSYRKLLLQSKKLVRISDSLQKQLGQRTDELKEQGSRSNSMCAALINIGKALSQLKDHDELLRKILMLSKESTGADAGSIYTVETEKEATKHLVFRYSHTFSKDLPYEQKVLPYDTQSIAGYVAITGNTLNIEDVYQLDGDAPVSFNRHFDQAFDYRTKSMLVVPMRNHWDEIIGVIQLINCTDAGLEEGGAAHRRLLRRPEDFEEHVIRFDVRYEGLMEAIASQAAIALENNRMIKQIEQQFDHFVKASVAAIESRDPATSGHSLRVAQMCLNTARAANEVPTGKPGAIRFSDVELKELEMAALLHDFGKLYIEPAILLKGKKLYPKDFAHLMLRLEYIYRCLQLEHEARASHVSAEGAAEGEGDKLKTVKEIMTTAAAMNEPTVMEEDPEQLIENIHGRERQLACTYLDGRPVPLLTESEIENLRVKRGTLNKEEKAIIEQHVEHTYSFARKIPWPVEFRNIPDIVRGHHERLDGSGYPLRLRGKENIPVQSRIMAIADVFDALSAADRPYKKAVPLDRVFVILREEARKEQLDAELVELFISRKAFEASPARPS